jgi:hypothetical protein
MQSIRFVIRILPEDVLRYYQGIASQVLVRAEDGRRIRFPFHHLRPFVGSDGVSGRFEMLLDDGNKCMGINRLA